MPRPQRCRRICREPEYIRFSPGGISTETTVSLSVDEYEVIRLVDHENLTHEQCAKQMDISRTTVTEIYDAARHKIADCIVNGKDLVIGGGNYRLCDGTAEHCCGKPCKNHLNSEHISEPKGENTMRIAVTYENGMIFQHFGHTSQFKVYDIEDGTIVKEFVVDTMGQGHGALAGFLFNNDVDALICGGIGGGAQNALHQAGIKLFGGCRGLADDAVKALLAGELNFNPNVRCGHHGEDHTCGSHHDHGEGHSCGGHGNGSCHHE